MVKVWAEKEMRNLKRIYGAGIPAPEPLYLRLHVLVMEFLGDKKGWPAPRLKDVVFEGLSADELDAKWQALYVQLLGYMRIMYQVCRLVHADLSEYNLLYHNEKLYMIDVSQSVEHDHPHSLEFLRKDIKNVSDFFRSRNVEALSERKVYMLITNPEGSNDMDKIAEEVEDLFQKRGNITEEERRQEEIDDEVFREQYIPQTLEQVYDIERDAELVGEGKGEGLVYQGLLADKIANKHDEDGEEDGGEDTEDTGDEDADESIFEKGTPRGKRNMDKDAKREHKKAVKEEKREKRKEKMPKHLKKKLVSQSSRKH
jgi:RIO kinase 1